MHLGSKRITEAEAGFWRETGLRKLAGCFLSIIDQSTSLMNQDLLAGQVEKTVNFNLMMDYLATFAGDLPTQSEVEAI